MNLPPLLYYSGIALRTLIVLFFLVIGLRVFGRQGAGGLNLIDLALILLLGNAVQNAITTGSGDLLVGMVSVTVLLAVDRFVGALFIRHPLLESRYFGEPTVLVTDGKLHREAMQHEGVTQDEVIQAVHEQGLSDLNQVHLGILEDDGTISIIPKSSS